jgi:heat shock protein HslJ
VYLHIRFHPVQRPPKQHQVHLTGSDLVNKLVGQTLTLACLGALLLAAAACVPVPAPAPPPGGSIQGIVWQWTSVTNQTTRETQTVPNPENYTIIFNTDGTLNGKADCNAFTGSYSQQNGFSIKLGASTMAFCGEASLDQQYLGLLANVAAGGPDGAGGLALETAGGEQRMLFMNGGAAAE